MSDSTPRQLRLTAIQTLHADSAALMATAEHESMKEEIRRTNRDLDEARRCLTELDIDSRPGVLAIVDSAITEATDRLNAVDQGFRTYGPGAKFGD